MLWFKKKLPDHFKAIEIIINFNDGMEESDLKINPQHVQGARGMESERHGLGLAVGLLHGEDVVLRGGDRPDDGVPVP